jgi:hypothetical protein
MLSLGVNGAAAMPDPDLQNSMAHIMPVTIHASFWYLPLSWMDSCFSTNYYTDLNIVLAQINNPILTLF